MSDVRPDQALQILRNMHLFITSKQRTRDPEGGELYLECLDALGGAIAERDALKGTVEIMAKNLKPGVAYDGLRVHGQLNRSDGLILPNSPTGG